MSALSLSVVLANARTHNPGKSSLFGGVCPRALLIDHAVWVLAFARTTAEIASQHLMHVDHHALGVAGDGGDEEVFHQPAIVRVTV